MLPVILAIAASSAATLDPAVVEVGGFYAALLDTMKAGPALGLDGRVRRLRPVVEATFNIPAMSQFAVGARWTAMSTEDRQAIVGALTRYTIRSYAHNFERFSGEELVVDPQALTRGLDKLVKTKISTQGHEPIALNYRMREYAGKWRIIDVYFNAISQLTAQRSDFEAALASGGASALVRKLDGLTEKLR